MPTTKCGGDDLNDDATAPASAGPARWRYRVGRSMMPLFVGLIAVLLILSISIGQTIIAQRNARLLATNEGSTLLALNEVMSALLNAETGQRGFQLTRKAEYLTPYLDARERFDRAMARLHKIAARNAEDGLREPLTQIERMAEAKFDEMDRAVKLTEGGLHDQAMALIQADFGKVQMDGIREQIRTLSLAKAARRRAAFVDAEKAEMRLLPLVGVLSLVILVLAYAGIRAEGRRSLAAAAAAQAQVLREANDRAELLARELNHRVKNLFSVILSIVTLSGRKPASSGEVVDDIRARVRALSLAHSASQGGYGTASVELGPVIARTMEPYSDAEGRRVLVQGPAVDLPARMVTPLGMIIHELATNAVKYGALSHEAGTVRICWIIEPGEVAVLALDWIEAGGPPVPADVETAAGFGSQMTRLAASQIDGTIERRWPPTGAVVALRFPLPGPVP